MSKPGGIKFVLGIANPFDEDDTIFFHGFENDKTSLGHRHLAFCHEPTMALTFHLEKTAHLFKRSWCDDLEGIFVATVRCVS